MLNAFWPTNHQEQENVMKLVELIEEAKEWAMELAVAWLEAFVFIETETDWVETETGLKLKLLQKVWQITGLKLKLD